MESSEQLHKCKKCLFEGDSEQFKYPRVCKNCHRSQYLARQKSKRIENKMKNSMSTTTAVSSKCFGCLETKPVSQFNKDSSTNSGVNLYCRNCSRANSIKYAKKNSSRTEIVELHEYSCSRCGLTRAKEMFSVVRSRTNGRASQCKDCDKKYNIASGRYVGKYLMVLMEGQNEKWCYSCTTMKNISEFHNNKRHRKGKDEKCVDCARAEGHARRARKAEVGGRFTGSEWARVKDKYGHKCLACGIMESAEVKLHADHVVPLFVGGPNDISNIQPLCARCNGVKGTKTIDYRPASSP